MQIWTELTSILLINQTGQSNLVDSNSNGSPIYIAEYLTCVANLAHIYNEKSKSYLKIFKESLTWVTYNKVWLYIYIQY